MSEIHLEKLIGTICDTSDLTDAEVRKELVADGVDVDAVMARFRPKLNELMRARAVRLALADLKANPLRPGSPLPWRDGLTKIFDANGHTVWVENQILRAHIAAAVNAAPVLAAEIERLTALLAAARVAVKKLWTECRHDCACVNLPGRDCDCGAAITIELRRAVGLEGSHG